MTWVRKLTAVALVAGGLVGSGPAVAQAADVAPMVVNCVDAGPPSPNFYRDTRHLNPNACGKCRDRGESLERTGRWDAHCQNRYNPAGTLTAVQLWLRCVACRPVTTAAMPERA